MRKIPTEFATTHTTDTKSRSESIISQSQPPSNVRHPKEYVLYVSWWVGEYRRWWKFTSIDHMDTPTAHNGTTAFLHFFRFGYTYSTATADGHMMYELLNTFSTNESIRFQSHQRSSLAASVIEQYVAACIEHRYHRNDHHQNKNNHTAGSSPASALPPPSRLEDYVSTPSQASDIGMIVATAAKIYAQRLMAEAALLQKKDIQQQQQQKTSQTATNNTNSHDTTTTATAMDLSSITGSSGTTHHESINPHVLLCTYVYQAVQDRQLRQVDPGFFMASSSSTATSTTDYNVHQTTSNALYDQRRLATMAVLQQVATAVNDDKETNDES